MNWQHPTPKELIPKALPLIDKWKMVCYDCEREFYLAIRFEYNSRFKKVIKTKWSEATCFYCKSKNINTHEDTNLGAYA